MVQPLWSNQMSLFDKLILAVCLLHPVFLSDVLSDVIGVSSKGRLQTCESNFAYVSGRKFGTFFYDPPRM